MPGTSKYEITRDIHGAIRLITNADTTALTSPRNPAFRDGGRVCPVIYVAEGFHVDRMAAWRLVFANDYLFHRLTDYLAHLYDSEKSKTAGKRAVLRFLKLYRDDQLAAQREAIQHYNSTVSFEPFPNP